MGGKAGGGRTARTRHTFSGGYEMAGASLNRNCKLQNAKVPTAKKMLCEKTPGATSDRRCGALELPPLLVEGMAAKLAAVLRSHLPSSRCML
jgi:hypothetical protein